MVPNVKFLSISAPIIRVSTMEPAFKELVHSPVAAFLASPDRNVKQRLMRVTPTPATMVQLATVCLLPILVPVLLDLLVMTVPQELTIATTLLVIMVAPVPVV